jgi:hypothetical protein
MARQTWLADVLRGAGLKVVEVRGWKTRGSESFHPIGVTWHATAGSRQSTAQGEVNVILNGSTSAPPPIAQLMLYRDGTFYVCAAGRCNHNKVGWGGPNEGLGNSDLLGIEMANDNKGEPWSAAQVDAVRRGTAAICKHLGIDPLRRLAAHFEHQPGAKTDPFGFKMNAERTRVAALVKGEDDDGMAGITQAEFDARMSGWWNRVMSSKQGTKPGTELAYLRRAAANLVITGADTMYARWARTEAYSKAAADAVTAMSKAFAAFAKAEGADDAQVEAMLTALQEQVALIAGQHETEPNDGEPAEPEPAEPDR